MSKFRQFIRTYVDDKQQFIYRDQLRANYAQGDQVLNVDLNDLLSFDSELHSVLRSRPAEYLPYFELAAKQVLVLIDPNLKDNDVPPFQVTLRSYPRITAIRRLAANHVSQLVAVRGIVISATKPRIKATNLTIVCRNCRTIRHVRSGQGFGTAQLPRTCDTQTDPKCPLDPYVVLADSSEYINVQTMKLQEHPEIVPTGEMPRHVTLSCERALVGQVKPGTRVTIIGIHTTYTPKQGGGGSADQRSARSVNDVGIRIPYIRVIGIEQDSEANDILMGRLTTDDIDEVKNIVQSTPDIYQAIAGSIAPAIKGRDDVKRAIACALFGGVRRSLPDGTNLRGDINVLLLGDPSVAKSQFLKFASQVAPISVYTSGKGSSAAGLTAAVIRDPASGEFHLEGGALVLADGGVVCIDEFDKVRGLFNYLFFLYYLFYLQLFLCVVPHIILTYMIIYYYFLLIIDA